MDIPGGEGGKNTARLDILSGTLDQKKHLHGRAFSNRHYCDL